jgi:hypothetical protein
LVVHGEAPWHLPTARSTLIRWCFFFSDTLMYSVIEHEALIAIKAML